MCFYKNNIHNKKKPEYYYWILLIFSNPLWATTALLAVPRYSDNALSQQQHLELKVYSKKNEEIHFSSYNSGFLSPLKYQIKNEIFYFL